MVSDREDLIPSRVARPFFFTGPKQSLAAAGVVTLGNFRTWDHPLRIASLWIAGGKVTAVNDEYEGTLLVNCTGLEELNGIDLPLPFTLGGEMMTPLDIPLYAILPPGTSALFQMDSRFGIGPIEFLQLGLTGWYLNPPELSGA